VLGSCCFQKRSAPRTCCLKDKIRRLELVLWSSVYNYTIHIPNSTESFKLDRQETGATEVYASSLDLVGLNLFSGIASPTALGALTSED
jgi:hypothetical protein